MGRALESLACESVRLEGRVKSLGLLRVIAGFKFGHLLRILAHVLDFKAGFGPVNPVFCGIVHIPQTVFVACSGKETEAVAVEFDVDFEIGQTVDERITAEKISRQGYAQNYPTLVILAPVLLLFKIQHFFLLVCQGGHILHISIVGSISVVLSVGRYAAHVRIFVFEKPLVHHELVS